MSESMVFYREPTEAELQASFDEWQSWGDQAPMPYSYAYRFDVASPATADDIYVWLPMHDASLLFSLTGIELGDGADDVRCVYCEQVLAAECCQYSARCQCGCGATLAEGCEQNKWRPETWYTDDAEWSLAYADDLPF
jgi:hypothetical protein